MHLKLLTDMENLLYLKNQIDRYIVKGSSKRKANKPDLQNSNRWPLIWPTWILWPWPSNKDTWLRVSLLLYIFCVYVFKASHIVCIIFTWRSNVCIRVTRNSYNINWLVGEANTHKYKKYYFFCVKFTKKVVLWWIYTAFSEKITWLHFSLVDCYYK